MADAIGLYPGNPVTQMGYQIGKVTNVTPEAQDVRVEFALNEERTLPKTHER
jgi:ABC-type transporter Mla subunit MlaD